MSLTQINKAGLDEIALDHVFTIGASGSSAYTFQGEGLNGTVNNPTLYLTRGKTYRFENGTGAHPIRIQSTSGASGTAYNTGVTNNAGSGTVIVEVQHDAPDVLYYQCTSHAAMNGILYITGALADGGVTTAKIADDAVTDAKLANSINSAIAANTAKASITINNNADNRVITGSGTANTLNGESNLTFSSSLLVTDTQGSVNVGGNYALLKRTSGTTNYIAAPNADAVLDISADETIKFGTVNTSDFNSTERMRLDSSGRLLLGTTVEGHTSADNLTINDSANSGLTIRSGSSNVGTILFSDATSGAGEYAGYLDYAHNDNRMTFGTNGAERMRINSAGNVGIGTNNPGSRLEIRNNTATHGVLSINRANDDAPALLLGNNSNNNALIASNNTDLLFGRDNSGTFTERMRMLNGGGLTFNGDTAAANALDDYEEGTHTPSDASSQVTFNNAEGHYTKIGRLVVFQGSVTWPSTGGQYGVGISLPFSGSSNGRTAGGGFTRYTNKSETQTSHVSSSQSNFTLYTYGGQQLKNADMSGKRFDFVIVYSTAH